MRDLKMVKKLFILIITIGMVVMFSNFVYAEDDDAFISLNITNSAENNTASSEGNTNSNGLFTNIVNTNNPSNTAGTLTTNNTTNNSTANNTINNTTNRSVSNTEKLAKTGLTDSNGIVALIVIICAVSAIYSYKKINDYKRL